MCVKHGRKFYFQDVEADYLPRTEDEAEELEIKEIQLEPNATANGNDSDDQRPIMQRTTYTKGVRSAVFI